jgi:hypothetical protein
MSETERKQDGAVNIPDSFLLQKSNLKNAPLNKKSKNHRKQ